MNQQNEDAQVFSELVANGFPTPGVFVVGWITAVRPVLLKAGVSFRGQRIDECAVLEGYEPAVGRKPGAECRWRAYVQAAEEVAPLQEAVQSGQAVYVSLPLIWLWDFTASRFGHAFFAGIVRPCSELSRPRHLIRSF